MQQLGGRRRIPKHWDDPSPWLNRIGAFASNGEQGFHRGDLTKTVRGNLRLIWRLARRSVSSVSDAFQQGAMGMMVAFEKFDDRRGSSFSGFAANHVLWKIRRLDKDRYPINVPPQIVDIAWSFCRMWDPILWDTPDEEIAAMNSGCTVYYVAAARVLVKTTFISMNELLIAEGDTINTEYADAEWVEQHELIASDDGGETRFHEVDRERLMCVLAQLPPRDEFVLRLRFGYVGEPQSHEKISELLGLSRSRIQQIEVEAFKKLRKMLCVNEIA